ncbi:hypothetical protein FACS1894190_04870 [Spirochaetia bacterium]|nr:hypothetical protein FACS1894190_04870 [Spirochaetia bacterium]
MKKLLSFLLVSTVIAVGTMFALDLPDAVKIPGLSVSGDIHTGLRIDGEAVDQPTGWTQAGTAPGSKSQKEDVGEWAATTGLRAPTINMYSDDVDNGTGFRAQLVVTYAPGPIGIQTRFRFDAGVNNLFAGGDWNNILNRAVIWGDLFAKEDGSGSLVRATLGKGMAGTWTSAWVFNTYGEGWDNFDGIDGLKVEVKPIKGLNAGLSIGGKDMVKNLINTAGGGSNQTPPQAIHTLNIGAIYDHDLFKATLGFRYFTYYESNVTSKMQINRFDESAYAAGNTANLFVSGQLKPSESLPLSVTLFLGFTGLGSTAGVWKDEVIGNNNTGEKYYAGDQGGAPGIAWKAGAREGHNYYWAFLPRLDVNYTIAGKIKAGLKIDDWLIADGDYGVDIKTATDHNVTAKPENAYTYYGFAMPISIKPYVSYQITDALGAGLEFGFKINTYDYSKPLINQLITPFAFSLKPGVEFTLSKGAKFVVYDEVTFFAKVAKADTEKYHYRGFGTADYTVDASGSQVPNGDLLGGVTNKLQFDFVWSF